MPVSTNQDNKGKNEVMKSSAKGHSQLL